MTKVLLSLGSNLGDSIDILNHAIDDIKQHGGKACGEHHGGGHGGAVGVLRPDVTHGADGDQGQSALAVEVGMQNSGLATGLAKAHFAALPAATVPGAVFSAWHNISGALLAWAYQNYLNPKFDPDYGKEEA